MLNLKRHFLISASTPRASGLVMEIAVAGLQRCKQSPVNAGVVTAL